MVLDTFVLTTDNKTAPNKLPKGEKKKRAKKTPTNRHKMFKKYTQNPNLNIRNWGYNKCKHNITAGCFAYWQLIICVACEIGFLRLLKQFHIRTFKLSKSRRDPPKTAQDLILETLQYFVAIGMYTLLRRIANISVNSVY